MECGSVEAKAPLPPFARRHVQKNMQNSIYKHKAWKELYRASAPKYRKQNKMGREEYQGSASSTSDKHGRARDRQISYHKYDRRPY